MTPWQLRAVARCAARGGIIAYPTEGVWGLGCDPADETALRRLLSLKQRPAHLGLILIAADFAQLRPWLAVAEPPPQVLASWPGPVSWLLPARAGVSPLLRGAHDTLAVRVSAHPPVRALCQAFGGALVSTSANRHGRATPSSRLRLRRHFGDALDAVLPGPLGGRARPSEIRDAATGSMLRS